MWEKFIDTWRGNVVSCEGNSNVQISSGSSGKSITVQNDVRIETDADTIRVSFKKHRKVYINGELYCD